LAGVVAAKVRPAGRAVAPPGDRGRRGAAALGGSTRCRAEPSPSRHATRP